jgi:large subunit ribosomal protein L21
MYAIVEIAGQQFKIEKDQRLFVHQLEAKEGSKVNFENVLLLENGGQISVGAPVVTGVKVTAKVERHLKGDKVIVFKKKRRKGYKVKNGHRQCLSEISITDIAVKKDSNKKKEKKTDLEEKTVAKKVVVKKETSVKKAAPKKKAVAKKTVAKTETSVKKAAPKKKAATKKEDK